MIYSVTAPNWLNFNSDNYPARGGFIRKNGCFWEGAQYNSILEQGSFDDHKQKALVLSAAGRIKAALDRKQYHLDEMEEKHKMMLCTILSIILYQRF
ncbi:hypothetical protein [Vibrio zhugei]|uniref:hypothetical protein n=1 Tax=Vibrio zhugei TaxID=2479546 RepID=UPI000F0BB6C5|nr:hypothetical protein [Vibrio zhugei]